ncbi:hypothetical protein PVAP13_7KG132500 [Panicum virgatum]|uniref:Uncharacterized protein n=1 Tax=Panicum virgatum TaxID=38727 RepID=A0A8T0QM20_PANVG|nr:hypothetical protein PVAP13_7KG132500 [Panicum virgatum]
MGVAAQRREWGLASGDARTGARRDGRTGHLRAAMGDMRWRRGAGLQLATCGGVEAAEECWRVARGGAEPQRSAGVRRWAAEERGACGG